MQGGREEGDSNLPDQITTKANNTADMKNLGFALYEGLLACSVLAMTMLLMDIRKSERFINRTRLLYAKTSTMGMARQQSGYAPIIHVERTPEEITDPNWSPEGYDTSTANNLDLTANDLEDTGGLDMPPPSAYIPAKKLWEFLEEAGFERCDDNPYVYCKRDCNGHLVQALMEYEGGSAQLIFKAGSSEESHSSWINDVRELARWIANNGLI